MENKKALIGGILGIGLLIGLVWYLFFRKKSDGKAIINILPQNPPTKNTATQQPTKTVYVNSSVASAFPMQMGSRGENVKLLQEALTKAGFDTKGADGAWGNNTQVAFKKAFPDKIGVNDLKELEDILKNLASRSGGASTTSTNVASSGDTGIKMDSNFKGVRHTVTSTTPVFREATDPRSTVAYYEKGDKIILTGRWQRVNGEIWSEFERHNNNGLAWIKDVYITRG
jgi:hypothetical protein